MSRGAPSTSAARGNGGEMRVFAHQPLLAAALAWAAGWLCGNIAGSAVLAACGGTADSIPVWQYALVALAGWLPMVAAAVWWAHAAAPEPHRSIAARLGCTVRPTDLLGVPIGAAVQLAVVPALYWALRRAWPTTFDTTKVERHARELVGRTHGGWWIVLVAVVVVGAPFVEELMYRGVIFGSLRGRLRTSAAVLVSAAFFALIHFRPVEFPGLVVIGAVLAALVAWRGRLGMAMLAHAGFNAAGLIVAARR